MDPSAGIHEIVKGRWVEIEWESIKDRKAAIFFVLILASPFLLLGVSVVGVIAVFLPFAFLIRWLEAPHNKLQPLFVILLCLVNVASLLDIGSDIIVSAEGVLVLLGLGGRGQEQYSLLARLALVYVSVIPYFLIYVLWELTAPDQSKRSILKGFLIFLLFAILWKVALLVCRLFIIFKILTSTGLGCKPLDGNTSKQVEWCQFLLVGDIVWSSVPLATLTCYELYYDAHAFAFVLGIPAFEMAKLVGLGVTSVGVAYIIYIVLLFNWSLSDPNNPRTHLQ